MGTVSFACTVEYSKQIRGASSCDAQASHAALTIVVTIWFDNGSECYGEFRNAQYCLQISQSR